MAKRRTTKQNGRISHHLGRVFSGRIHLYRRSKTERLPFIAKLTKLEKSGALEEARDTPALRFMTRTTCLKVKDLEAALKALVHENPIASGDGCRSFVDVWKERVGGLRV